MPGEVRSLEHTADVGIEVRAPDLEALFDLAARGMLELIRGERPAHAGDIERTVELEAGDVAGLMVAWLRELLYLHAVDGLAYHSASFEALGPRRLRARVTMFADDGPSVREIKGVTYHALRVEGAHDGWHARVIFDV